MVNTSGVANFTLVATQGTSATDDKNENQTATPGTSTTFTNKLTNTGNLADTYTLAITTNNDTRINTGNQDYVFTSPSSITYTIKNADGTNATVLAAGQAQTGTVASGGTISLLPGQYADLSYTLTTPTTQSGGQSGVGTLTATSSKITTNGTLVNENQAIVKLPVFKIQKTASVTNIDLNSVSTFDYTISVTNDSTAPYAADATNILVEDILPNGLQIDPASTVIITSPNTVSGSTSGSTATKLVVNGANLNVGQTMTIKFTVKVTDKAALAAAGSATNNATIYDNYGNTPVDPNNPSTADIKDSTSTSDPTGSKVPNDPTGTTGTGADNPATVTFSSRGLTLDGTSTQELPPTSAPTAPATYTHTITNTGNTPESGLKFTITDPNTGNNINVGTVTYDPTPASPNSGDEFTLTATNGSYTIPGSIAAGGKGSITYTVNTTGATIGTSETTTVTLTPAPVTGTTTPTVPAVSDTTNVQSMKLVKEQALDATCDGTADTAFASAAINANPGQCVIYKITATNTMTTKSLTNVVISDVASQWNTKATYVANSAKDSASGTVTQPGAAVTSSALTLLANGTGSLQFAVKINGAQ